MRGGAIGRAAAVAATAALLISGTVLADSITADADPTLQGVQASVDLGTVAPGATIHRDVNLTLVCKDLYHVDPGQLVTVFQSGSTVPAAGGSITATSATIGPVPTGWADDTGGISGCDSALQVTAASPSHVTIVAPTTPGAGYGFTAIFDRSLSPAGVSDPRSVAGFISVTFTLDVAAGDSVPPSFVGAPPDLDVVTSDPGGTSVDFALPAATDDADPAPVVACDPAPGAAFPVGTTRVTCIATDASGNAASVSFSVTVQLASVRWGDPVHDNRLSVLLGRTVPIKVRALLDGIPLVGPASLRVAPCGSIASTAAIPLVATRAWASAPSSAAGSWMATLRTAGLGIGCHRVDLVAAGLALGSLELDVVAPAPRVGDALRGTRPG
jgi:hypothetical protein